MLRRAPRIVGNADAADIGSLLDYIAERHALWSAHVSELVQELNRSTSTGRVPITPFMGAMTDALVEIEGSFSHLAQRVRDEEHEAAEKPGSARARDAMEG